MSYVMLVNDVASGKSVEEVYFSSIKPSFIFHGY